MKRSVEGDCCFTVDIPWLLAGDFNEVLCSEEKLVARDDVDLYSAGLAEIHTSLGLSRGVQS